MKRFLQTIFCAGSMLLISWADPGDDAVTARRAAMELAGAWTNDGFQLRDGHWAAPIAQGESRIILVNLYAGNAYWFSTAHSSSEARMQIAVFDEFGALLTGDSFADGPRAAMGITARESGPHYVRIQQTAGTPGAAALLYSYK